MRTLLALHRTEEAEEALFAAEQGRAQGLTDLMLLYIALIKVILSDLTNTEETVSYVSSNVNTEAVFLALEGNTINFWVPSQRNILRYRQKKVAGEEDASNFLQNLTKNAVQENAIRGRIVWCHDISETPVFVIRFCAKFKNR